MRQQIISFHALKSLILRVYFLYEASDDEITLKLTAKAKHEGNKVDDVMSVGHCFEVRIDWENDISDTLVYALISELLRKFAYELAHGVVIVAEQLLAYLTALALEFDRIGVGNALIV